MTRPILCLATRNMHKIKELASLVEAWFTVKSVRDYPGTPEVEETGETFLANAELKAHAVSLATGTLALADDSGIEVDALAGAPGVYSARYAGLKSSDEQNNQKLLAELKKVGAMTRKERAARFRCLLVLAEAGKTVATFDGTCEGHVIEADRGKNGFGYDPLFIPDGFSETFGELADTVKARISHRAKALELFAQWMRSR